MKLTKRKMLDIVEKDIKKIKRFKPQKIKEIRICIKQGRC
jgi:hypothetical protein